MILWLFEVWSSKAWSCSNILRWLWILCWFTQNFVPHVFCHESPTIEFTFAWVVLNHSFSAEWFKFVPELVALSRDLAAAETHRCPQVFHFVRWDFTYGMQLYCENFLSKAWVAWYGCEVKYLIMVFSIPPSAPRLKRQRFRVYGKRKLTWQLWFLKGITVTATVCNYLQLFATFCNCWFAF